MASEAPDGPSRLGGAGIGSIGGGLTLGALSFLLPYAFAAAGALVVGIAVWVSSRWQTGSGTGIGLGCGAVGAIGLFEAFGLGLGVPPLVLAAIAVGAGVIDVVLGGVFGRLSGASR